MPPTPQWRMGRRDLRRYARGGGFGRLAAPDTLAPPRRRTVCAGPRLVLHGAALTVFGIGLYFIFF